ncbi:MAG TPA: type II toxin-antitoxin system RelE/ParE family toxin, partial [Acidobacteriota bacterium]
IHPESSKGAVDAARRGLWSLKMYGVRYLPEAARRIAKLPPEVKKLIRSAIDELRKDPEKGSELSGELAGYYSFKPGRYRIIYRLHPRGSYIEIYHVGHRRDVYENLRTLLESW